MLSKNIGTYNTSLHEGQKKLLSLCQHSTLKKNVKRLLHCSVNIENCVFSGAENLIWKLYMHLDKL